ncbi:MAG: cobyrinate a,c-diamide synthase [Pseudomonadota bacterium]
MSAFFLSAAHKSSGKTTVSIGLCAALRGRLDLRVQAFKKGPDYIDPLWLAAASGRACHNLDFFVQQPSELAQVFARQSLGADVVLVEGNKGLYDGVALDGSNSNAALAQLLDIPVVLVIDCRGITRGIAPLLAGYRDFVPRVRIGGVILNRVGGARHENKLRQAVEHYTDIPVLGAIPENEDLEIVERHLGLMPSNEHGEAQSIIGRISDIVGSHVDLEKLVTVGGPMPVLKEQGGEHRFPAAPDVRIGIPRDAAFGFYYPDDLDALRHAGAELVFFDSLADARLPEADGLFIGGGFPETQMAALEANTALRAQVAGFVAAGGPVYAECGGLMYLCRSLTWQDKACKMVGVIPADVVMGERPQGRGYVLLRETPNHPWPAERGRGDRGAEVPAHEFHYSRLEHLEGPLNFAYEVSRGYGVDGAHDGILYKNMLASYAHLRDVAGNHWTQRFVEFVRACRTERRGAPAREVEDDV